MMRVFDCHCDTLTRMERENLPFSSPALHLNALDTAGDRYHQVFAVYTQEDVSDDDGWQTACRIFSHGFSFLPPNVTGYFSIEDGRILHGSLLRLSVAKRLGVKILTPFWRGENELGGAWDTGAGLTTEGRALMSHAIRLGIVPDVSHASTASAEEILYLAKCSGTPVVASHGGAFTVCPHRRNLPDEILRRVIASGGLCGVTLYAPHLSPQPTATAEDVFSHVSHLLSLGGENSVCLGTDFDGCDHLPENIRGCKDLGWLSSRLAMLGFSPERAEKFFWKNGALFAAKYF